MPEQPPKIICGICGGAHPSEAHAQYAQGATGSIEKDRIEAEPGPEKNAKEIFDEMIMVNDHKELIKKGRYQGNAMMALQRAYKGNSTFLGEPIPEQLYHASMEVDSRVRTLNEQVDRQIYNLDSVLLEMGQEQWDPTLLINAQLEGIVTKDEVKRVMEERKKRLTTPEWLQAWQEFEAFAQRVHDDYFDFLDSTFMHAKKEDLAQLEQQIFADLRRAEIDNKSQEDVVNLNSILVRIQQHLNKFEERAVDEREREQRVSGIIEKIKSKYNISEIPTQLDAQLYTADVAFGGLQNLKGKKVLDLGCGSTADEDSLQLMQRAAAGDSQAYREIIQRGMHDLFLNYSSTFTSLRHRMYEPWFCRALLELGAEPVGIDVGNLEGEAFEHYKLDLSKPGVLNFIPDHSFDAVNMRQLFSSPQLSYTVSLSEKERMEEEIKKQLRRLLKLDGVVLSTDFHN